MIHAAPPPKLTGKAFEQILIKEAKRLATQGVLTMGRYGVMGALIKNVWTPIPSLPDFEGVDRTGRQFIIEAKVCGQSSFQLDTSHFKSRQFSHMVARARFGVPCWLLIHWTERTLKTKSEPAVTTAIPVDPNMPFWVRFSQGQERSIPRQTALELGRVIPWGLTSVRSSIAAPDLAQLATRKT